MKSPVVAALTALLALGAPFALAATNPDSASDAAPQFVNEPIASAGTLQGPDAPLAASVTKALNGDPSLAQSKIAVLGEDGKVYLSGATMTMAQRKTAVQIAEAQAGQGKVVDAMQATDSLVENASPGPKT